jgi:hypothetical protein
MKCKQSKLVSITSKLGYEHNSQFYDCDARDTSPGHCVLDGALGRSAIPFNCRKFSKQRVLSFVSIRSCVGLIRRFRALRP